MPHLTKINPKLPVYYKTGGGVQRLMTHLDDVHSKELALMTAKHDFEMTSLKRKHADQKSKSVSGRVNPSRPKSRKKTK
jgi:hypothetical protein